MIASTYIIRNLTSLASSYQGAKKPLHLLLFAKLAIIEAGGWVEMSMDDLVLRCGRKLKVPDNATHLKKQVVDKTWGFDYDKHFRQMLIKAIGLVTVEKIERSIDGAKFAKMSASLALLKAARNDVAHTYVKYLNPASPIPSPPVVKGYVIDIYDGLKEIESVMRGLRLI